MSGTEFGFAQAMDAAKTSSPIVFVALGRVVFQEKALVCPADHAGDFQLKVSGIPVDEVFGAQANEFGVHGFGVDGLPGQFEQSESLALGGGLALDLLFKSLLSLPG
ncbi:MAG: hypothetical protein FJ271_07785 [Planctomycetes bacterium]|nr:hypothetical protein [Planctomycetota bacterium]